MITLKKGIALTPSGDVLFLHWGGIMTEKRASERQPYFEEMELGILMTGTAGEVTVQPAYCLDISRGGLGLSSSHRLRENQIVKISLPVKGFHATVPVLAEVSWVKADKNGNRAGVRYLI
jgi:hypothetical protein